MRGFTRRLCALALTGAFAGAPMAVSAGPLEDLAGNAQTAHGEAKEGDDLDTWDITEKTLQCTSCMSYRLAGACTWLKCRALPPSCEVRTSVLVDHFLPDFVVSVYSNTSPWKGLGGVGKNTASSILTDIQAVQPESNRMDTNLDFKHADIITNPAILLFNQMAASNGLSCESVETIPMMPHFISKYDPAWRSPLIEQFYPQALVGFPRQSELPEYWGPIYPRTGWTSLPHDAMSALVTAERASEILTGGLSLHVFLPPSEDCSRNTKCWAPPKVELGNRDNRFQLLYPKVEKDAEPLPRNGSWVNGMEVHDQRYSWVLWRRYKCCKEEGQFYLGKLEVNPR